MRGRLIACAIAALALTASAPAATAQEGPDGCRIDVHPDLALAFCATPHGARAAAGSTRDGAHAAASATHTAFMASFGGPHAGAAVAVTGVTDEPAHVGVTLVVPTIENDGNAIVCVRWGGSTWCGGLWGGYGRASPLAP